MVLRLTILFLVALGIFVGLRLILGKRQVTVRQFFLIYAAALAGLVLLYLGVTGRLPWLFSVIGAILPFIFRIVPAVLQFMHLKRAGNWFQRMTTGQAPASGQTSELNTRFFAMTLDHDSGHMDGRVLEGRFEGRMLSDLSLESLQALLSEVAADADSENVLRAYLDRNHEGWSDDGRDPGGRESTTTSGALTVNDAYDILGLEPGASRDDIREAHRRLIRTHHPDRGGSTWLAARINEAKEVLLQHLGEGR